MVMNDPLLPQQGGLIMKTKKLKMQINGNCDDFGTPRDAVTILSPYLKRDWKIWECAWGKGILANHLKSEGFSVVGKPDIDFLDSETHPEKYDCIVTNPPYSRKEEFLEKCYELGKPFSLLLPLTALEGKKRQELYRRYEVQLIIPNRRINFITPSGKGSGSWFMTAWFCCGLGLPKELNFIEANEYK
jgi:hypothetical protein